MLTCVGYLDAMKSSCCSAPTYTDSIDGGTYCTICDREQDPQTPGERMRPQVDGSPNPSHPHREQSTPLMDLDDFANEFEG